MKSLVIALAIVFTGVVLTFVLLNAVSVPKEFAGPASSVFLGALPYVHKQLDRRSKQPIPAYSKKQVVSLEGFALPALVILSYGLLLGLAATQGSSAVIGLLTAIASPAISETDATKLIMFASAPLQWFLGYLVARWIGVRSGTKGVLLLFAVFTAVVSVEHALRMILPAEIRAAAGAADSTAAWLQWAGGLLFWYLLALFGFWRGRRMQLRRYADYLLKKVAADTRQVVLALLRDEVTAITERSAVKTPGVQSGLSAARA